METHPEHVRQVGRKKARRSRLANPEVSKERMRRWRADNKEHYAQLQKKYQQKAQAELDALKNSPCTDCGGRFPPVCMDFDHRHGEKIANVSKMRGYAKARRDAEIAKCDLVCANCHRIRTHSNRSSRA